MCNSRRGQSAIPLQCGNTAKPQWLTRGSVLCAAVCVTSLQTATVAAEYPARPIRYIVSSAAGGAPDTIARVVGAEMARQMKQQIVVDNRPGAAGSLGYAMMARAPADGYTVGHGATNMAVNPSIMPEVSYDPDRDLQKVAQFITAPNLLAVTLSLPVKSVPELIDYARNHPRKLSFASTGAGGSMHLTGELFKLQTGVQILHVPYKAGQQAVTEMISGQVHMMFDNMGSIVPHVKAGRLRGLGVTSLKRSPAVPDLPALAEAGLPGFEVTVWSGLVVQAGVPRAIVNRLNAEVNAALTVPAVKEKLGGLGYELVGGTPEQFTLFVRKEITKWADVVKRTGARIE